METRPWEPPAQEPPTLRQKAIIITGVVLLVAIALCSCARYEKRRPHEELTDCLYHARFDFGMAEDERQFLERSCRAIYDMRERERMQ